MFDEISPGVRSSGRHCTFPAQPDKAGERIYSQLLPYLGNGFKGVTR